MELKIYLRILLKKWWIVLPAFLITFTSTIVFTFTQAPTYRAVATFVVTPTSSFEDIKSFASGLDMLSRRTEIATTYTEVAISHLIRNQASEILGLSQSQRENLAVESKLRAGTNVLEITVEGSDPVLVRDFANTVGVQTIAYVQDLFETYSLSPLDEAATPDFPTRPNKMLNLALGGVFGLTLGVGLAFLSTYLQTPLENVTNLGIFDDETGVYNSRYFKQRLGEEMSRAKRNEYPLSLAFINVDQLGIIDGSLPPQAHGGALRQVAVFLKQYLRQEDIIARLGETVFALLLPDVPEEKAQTMIEKLQTRVAWTPFELERSGVKLNLTSAAGVVAYNYNGTVQDEFLAQAHRALQQAEASGYGNVRSLAEDGEDN